MPSLRQKQTLASFDWQWRELPDGGALLAEPWFREHVDAILSEELLCVSRDWFPGRMVLDAGCGNGRWTIGLLKLGCKLRARACVVLLLGDRQELLQIAGFGGLARLRAHALKHDRLRGGKVALCER